MNLPFVGKHFFRSYLCNITNVFYCTFGQRFFHFFFSFLASLSFDENTFLDTSPRKMSLGDEVGGLNLFSSKQTKDSSQVSVNLVALEGEYVLFFL